MGRYRIPDHVNHLILGHFPGETFEADIDAAQEARLVSRGQIEIVGGLTHLSREELDTLARAHDIDPADHPNKPSLIDAIQAKTPNDKEQ